MSAERGVVAESEGTGHLWGVQGVLISQGRSMHLNCAEAIVSGGTEIRLLGQVRLGLDGYRVTTEDAVYRRHTGTAHAEERVEMDGPALRVAGRGVVVNVAQRTVRVGQDVRAWVGDVTR